MSSAHLVHHLSTTLKTALCVGATQRSLTRLIDAFTSLRPQLWSASSSSSSS
jgi:hypothetical protein